MDRINKDSDSDSSDSGNGPAFVFMCHTFLTYRPPPCGNGPAFVFMCHTLLLTYRTPPCGIGPAFVFMCHTLRLSTMSSVILDSFMSSLHVAYPSFVGSPPSIAFAVLAYLTYSWWYHPFHFPSSFHCYKYILNTFSIYASHAFTTYVISAEFGVTYLYPLLRQYQII